MPNIDDLSVGIKSNVTSAANSIDKLIKRLGVLSSSLGQVNTNGFYHMAQGINQIESATKQLTSDSATKLTNLSLAIRKFGSATANAATANIPQLASSITLLSNTMNSIGAVNFNADGVSQFASAISKLGGVKVGDAVTNLPILGNAINKLSQDITGLNANAGSVDNLTRLATALSRMGGKAVTTSISNIPQLTNALIQMFDALSKAPQVSQGLIRLTEAIANLASQGSKVGTATRSMSSGLTSFSSHAKGAHKHATSLASAIGKLYAKYWLLFRLFSKFGKSIEFASDLKEVQNVIDVSFGDYKNVIEEFSKTSIQDYGISELTAKKLAGRFQAMGTAVGFSQEKMSEMSTTLTGLAADMGSFYNVEAEQVAESLQSVFTGTTKPLRAYGIDLTNATLQEWLMSKGIDANVKSMTQAEKVMLRYNYVIEHTRNAQGDFQRTQGTWANQIRMLKQNFQALGGVIGQNFIYALKPVVTALNTVMLKLIQFARVVSESLGTIFGWKYEDTTGGIVDDLDVGADLSDDLSDGLGSAANNAKKLHQQLQGFDELNVLTTQQDTGKGGSGGGGGLGNYDLSATGGQWTKIDDADKFFTSDLDSLYKLGDHISTTLREQLQKIDWEEVYQGAKDWGKGLASFLNGYINPDTFYETGKAFAGALNTAIYAALSFAETFDFANFGNSIAQRVNGFFEELDTTSLAKAISKWITGALTSVTTFLTKTDFELIGTKVGQFITNIDWFGIVIDLGKLAKAILSALVGSLKGLLSDPNAMAELGLALASWFGAKTVISKISGAFSKSMSGDVASSGGTGLLSGLSNFLKTPAAEASLLQIGLAVAAGIAVGIGAYKWSEKNLSPYVYDWLVDNVGDNEPKEDWKDKWDHFGKWLSDTGNYDLTKGSEIERWMQDTAEIYNAYDRALKSGMSESDAMVVAMETANKLGAAFENLRDVHSKYTKTVESNNKKLVKTNTTAEEEQRKALERQSKNWKNYSQQQSSSLKKTTTDLSNATKSNNSSLTSIKVATNTCTTAMMEMWKKTGVDVSQNVGEMGKNVSNTLSTTNVNVTNSTNSMASTNEKNLNSMKNKSVAFGQSYLAVMSNTFSGTVDISKTQMANMDSVVGAGIVAISNTIKSKDNKDKWYNSAKSLAKSAQTGMTDKLVNSEADGGSTKSKVDDAMIDISNPMNEKRLQDIFRKGGRSLASSTSKGMYDKLISTDNDGGKGAVSNGMSEVSKYIGGSSSWSGIGTDLVQGLINGINLKWGIASGVGAAANANNGTLAGRLAWLATKLSDTLKGAFKIGSPSKLWRDEIGVWLPAGIGVGIERATPDLLATVDNLGKAVNEEMSGALTLATPGALSSNLNYGVSSVFEHEYNTNSMSSSIADGISNGIYSSQSEQNALLREQNELLYQILQKDAVSTDDLYNVIVKKNRDTFNRTGENLLFI